MGGAIQDKGELIVNTPQRFSALTGVEVKTLREAVKILPEEKRVEAKNLATGETETYGYDALVIAVGASPVMPPVEGAELPGVFQVRTPGDAVALREYLEENNVKKAE